MAGVGGDPAGLPLDGPLWSVPAGAAIFPSKDLSPVVLPICSRLVDSRVVTDGCFRSGDHDVIVVALDIARVEGHVALSELEP